MLSAEAETEWMLSLSNMMLFSQGTSTKVQLKQGPFQGEGAKLYTSNLNLMLQNRASMDMFLLSKKVGGMFPPPPAPQVGPVK